MSDCPIQSQLSAYHDGELDSQAVSQVEAHIATCAACREELAGLRNISGLFAAKAPAPMLPVELARLHRSLEGGVAGQIGYRPAEADFLRTAGMLSALAASILIISGVWLAEFPSRHAATLSPGVAVVPASETPGLPASVPDWERTALTLRVEPIPLNSKSGIEEGPQINQIGLADAGALGDNAVDSQVADWMVAGLSAGGGHANP